MIKSVERILTALLVAAIATSPCLASDEEFDYESVKVKKEPSEKRERSDYEAESIIPSWPMHTLKSLKDKSLKKRINPTNGKDNCLACCIAFFNLTHSNKLEAAPKNYDAQYNIELFERHAVLANQNEANQLNITQRCIVIKNETQAFVEEMNDKRIVFEAFDADTITDVLNALYLNTANGGYCVSGLLYFDWFDPRKKTYFTETLGDEEVRDGHFFNLYIYQEIGDQRVTLLVDPQLGEVLTLQKFMSYYKACIGRKAYIWTETRGQTSPFGSSEVKSEPAAEAQTSHKKAKADDVFAGPAQAAFKTEPVEIQSTYSEETLLKAKAPVKVITVGRSRIKIFKPPEGLSSKTRPVDIDLVSEEIEEKTPQKLLKLVLKIPPVNQIPPTYTGPESQSCLYGTRVKFNDTTISLISYLLREYLDPTDAARFAQTSRVGRELAAKHHFRMSSAVYESLYKETSVYVDDILNATRDVLFASPNLRSLDLSAYQSKTGIEYRILLKEIAEKNKGLRRLNLGFAPIKPVEDYEERLLALADACPDLMEISLENRQELSNTCITTLIMRCLNLKRLNLSSSMWPLGDKTLLFGKKNLTHLDLAHLPWVTGTFLDRLTTELPNLVHLNISREKSTSVDLAKPIYNFLRNRPKMQSLNFGNCFKDTMDMFTLNPIVTLGQLKELEHFNIAGPEMTGQFLDNLLTNCQKLKTLTVTGGDNLFSEETANLMRQHPTLETVIIESDMENCLRFKLDLRKRQGSPALRLELNAANTNNMKKIGIDFEQFTMLTKHFASIKTVTVASPISRENLGHLLTQLDQVESLTLDRFKTFNSNDEVHLPKIIGSKKSLRNLNMSVANIPLEVIHTLTQRARQLNQLILRELKLERDYRGVNTSALERLKADQQLWLNIELHTIDDVTHQTLSRRTNLLDENFKLVLTDN